MWLQSKTDAVAGHGAMKDPKKVAYAIFWNVMPFPSDETATKRWTFVV